MGDSHVLPGLAWPSICPADGEGLCEGVQLQGFSLQGSASVSMHTGAAAHGVVERLAGISA